MKKLTLLLSIMLLFGVAKGQESTEYLLEGEMNIGGFGGIMSELSWVKNKPIYSLGGGGGMLINQTFFIGGYGMGNVVDGPLFNYLNEPASFEMGHGGLWLGYNFYPRKVVHFSLSSRFGWGGLGLFNASGQELLSDGIFLLQPQLHVEVNLLPFMKLSAAGGYRAAFGVNNPFFNNADISSPFAYFSLLFGWFGD